MDDTEKKFERLLRMYDEVTKRFGYADEDRSVNRPRRKSRRDRVRITLTESNDEAIPFAEEVCAETDVEVIADLRRRFDRLGISLETDGLQQPIDEEFVRRVVPARGYSWGELIGAFGSVRWREETTAEGRKRFTLSTCGGFHFDIVVWKAMTRLQFLLRLVGYGCGD